MEVCEACGSRRVAVHPIEGIEVGECGLCGTLHGRPSDVEAVELRREARERGFDPAVYPLVQALERVPTFRVSGAAPGDPVRIEYPYVFLRLDAGGLAHLEHLLTSLEMANRETKRRWVVEAALQRGLLFILRPRFWKRVAEITRQDIEEARADLSVLARVLARDTRLPWWEVQGP